MFDLTKYDIGFGVGSNCDGEPMTPREVTAGLASIRREACELFGGYTLTPTTGGWVNPVGVLVEENGYTLTILVKCGVSARDVASFARRLGRRLYQHSVVLTSGSDAAILETK